MLIHDAAAATSREVTPEGFLRVRPASAEPVCTTTVRPSSARLRVSGRTTRCGSIARRRGVRRRRMDSFAPKPVTDGHPTEMVDARNWRRYAIGHSGPVAVRDGDHLAADLLITDAAAARASPGPQLSNGYFADFVFAPGMTPDGEANDAMQRNIRGNHFALVEAGRCGDACRIGDAAGPIAGEGADDRDSRRRRASIAATSAEAIDGCAGGSRLVTARSRR